MHSKELIDLVKKKRAEGLSFQAIASAFDLSKSVVRYMVSNDYTRPKDTVGRPRTIKRALSSRIKRQAQRRISEGLAVSAEKLKNDLDLGVSRWTIARELKRQGFSYTEVLKKLPLTKKHKEKRLEAARKWIADGHPWTLTVATDEKRFCKDGNDNEMSWLLPQHDQTIKNRKKRQMKGGGVMVWGAMTANGNFKLIRIQGRMNAEKYSEMLEGEAIPWMRSIFPDGNFNFLQDNASIHNAKLTLEKLDELGIRVLSWPARSPDLNVIENWWWMLSQKVYERGSFDNDDILWQAIQDSASWYSANHRQHFQNLFRSMGSRLLSVLDQKGGQIET